MGESRYSQLLDQVASFIVISNPSDEVVVTQAGIKLIIHKS